MCQSGALSIAAKYFQLGADAFYRKRSWRAFENRVARLAAGLRALGAERGNRVAILSLNSDRYLEYFYAVPWAGGALNPVNIRLAPPEIAYSLNDSASSILFVDDAFSDMLSKLRPLLEGGRKA